MASDMALVRTITARVLARLENRQQPGVIPVGVSVRHVHITPDDLETLYGRRELTRDRDLYQPGEFAAKEVVTLVGPRLRPMQGVRILGPLRSQTQVELSLTDCIQLGTVAPVRKSGDLVGSAAVVLVGPNGSVTLKEGVIRANRHIHMSSDHARQFGVKDDDVVRVAVPGERGVVFDNVQVRVKQGWRLQLHVDTDDANAAGVVCEMDAYIVR